MHNSHPLIEWAALREKYIVLAIPFEQVLANSPELRLVYDPGAQRLGVRLRVDSGRFWTKTVAWQNVAVRHVVVAGTPYVEVSTDSKDLLRPIYLLISDVLSRVLEGEKDSLYALELSFSDFELLLAKSGQISKQKAVGLFGELWVLRAILADGIAPASCWIGSSRESHDFRLGAFELEVKTTTANTRKHFIHGLNQLSPTPGHELDLISVRLNLAGSGVGSSVCSLVEDVRSLLESNKVSLRQFNRSVMTAGYDEEQPECKVAYELAAPLHAITVGDDFPTLSYDWLSMAIGSESASRVRDVELILDLEGLGKPFNTARYGN